MCFDALTRRLLIWASLALLALLSACSEPDTPLSIPFAAYFGEAAIACDQGSAPVQLSDLRLYVSDLQLLSTAGEATRIDLVSDDQWQQADLALLDLENAAGLCENGTSVTHLELQGNVAAGDYRGLSFTVGVPFERNHGDPLLAAPPLGDSAMHWSWRGGYKFLRAGVRTATDGYWLHLGSTGCEGTIQNITRCAAPNRVTVTLPDFEPGVHGVGIDLKALFEGVDLADAQATDCSSGPAETHCADVFEALGLEFATGNTIGQQRVFKRMVLD